LNLAGEESTTSAFTLIDNPKQRGEFEYILQYYGSSTRIYILIKTGKCLSGKHLITADQQIIKGLL
jgi:hypothetical protein